MSVFKGHGHHASATPREGGGQPQTVRLSASGTASGAGGPGASEARRYEAERRRATTPGGAGGVITPGSNFDNSEVDR
jgi:hypothetical protein